VRVAAEAAGLDEFIERLPAGYATVVGERGAALSAGERQRIAIARALLVNPSVLVLDEPTAALDPGTERQVAEGLDRVMRGRTTLLITHRMALAADADRVLVLGDGGILEDRSPERLALLEHPDRTRLRGPEGARAFRASDRTKGGARAL
jgi:ABC-type multidrug transport system fused ATPase/permease subunit